MAACDGHAYKVAGDNAKEISQYQAQRGDAIAFLLKTTGYVGEIKSLKSLPVGSGLVAQFKKMSELRAEGDVFGSVVSPLSHCRNVGYSAGQYWSVVAGNIRTQKPEEAFNAYLADAQKCQEQIDNAPAPVTYLETPKDKEPPFSGCLEVISLGEERNVRSWSCPSELLSKQ
ncbi:hypothetical protein ACNFIC_18235 [Pseudomonas sp. NY15463]|uniref:hypothetical protein n=1 Tax=Pseudomonas sp. NY15463 TaxID=3400361 RepID=UPI003A85CED6